MCRGSVVRLLDYKAQKKRGHDFFWAGGRDDQLLRPASVMDGRAAVVAIPAEGDDGGEEKELGVWLENPIVASPV